MKLTFVYSNKSGVSRTRPGSRSMSLILPNRLEQFDI